MIPARQLLVQHKEILTDSTSRITVLTGAGISAESGIPTFRGPEGYWTVGSRVYMPQEMATREVFLQHPIEVWQWYLYRLGVCLHVEPNDGHRAIARMEQSLGDRFILITQNIDNLHIRAGNSLERTYQIHGNINFTRCSCECSMQLYPLPDGLKIKREREELDKAEIQLLHCPDCGGWLRPHVLWFDEFYDEKYFRYESTIMAAANTDLLIIAGTSGATSLPNHVAEIVYNNGKPIIDINIEENPFSELARKSSNGLFIKESSAQVFPNIADLCAGEIQS
ncbi:MAG: NAD-dependent deacetylase [Gammaproteobacteria bacterium]